MLLCLLIIIALSRIAKDMRWWKLKPGYLETLVLHREANNLILDGVLKYQQN